MNMPTADVCTLVAYKDVGKGREHDHMDVGGRANQDEYRIYSVENVWSEFSRQSRGAEALPRN